MARGSSKLTDTAARSASLKPGRHSDGGGLYLNVSSSGSKSWLFMWVVAGKRREMGLGAYPAIGLAKEHRVPLSARAVEILRPLHEARTGDLVFPGQKAGRPLSNMAMEMLLRRMKVDVTVHGFRSAFRDWAGEETSFPREVAEQALAHTVGDATERAYRRGDALEKRRKLMEAWASYLAPTAKGIVKLRA